MLLAQAYEEFAKGDFVQASEKGWGATAQIVKAIAQERGWSHNSHRDLYQVVNALRHETGDAELAILFSAGGFLHVNFYENAYTGDTIGDHLRQVERFVDRAEGLLARCRKPKTGIFQKHAPQSWHRLPLNRRRCPVGMKQTQLVDVRTAEGVHLL